MTTTRKTIDAPMLTRAFTLDRRALDEEARTVDLAFSSEAPVDRWFGVEILDHAKASIRLDRISTGGPLLVDHNARDHIGTVESVNVGPDKRARARVRFGRSDRAEEIWQDVVDGIRQHVSVGYRIHRMVVEEITDDVETYRAVDWEPLEISLVSIPADVSVGVGRSLPGRESGEIIIEAQHREEPTMPDEPQNKPKPSPDVDIEVVRNEAREAERRRVRELTQHGERYAAFGGRELAAEMINDGRALDDLRAAVLERLPQRLDEGERETVLDRQRLGLTENETRDYSLFRAIRAQLSGDWREAQFELECSRELTERNGREPRGFFVPLEVQTRVMLTSGGGVGTDHMSDMFIDALRAQSVVMSLGATVLPGLVGDVSVPRLAGGATFYWLDEDDDVTDADGTLGAVALSPKTVAGSVPISRRALKQVSPSVEAMMMNDLRQGAALAIDLAALEGGGLNEPTGAAQTVGVNTATVTSPGAPTWTEIVGFESAVDADDALLGSLAYVTTPAVGGTLKTTAKDAGSGRFLAENGECNGYPLRRRTGLPANRILFGNFADIVIGYWGVLDVMPDEAAKAASGGLVLRVLSTTSPGAWGLACGWK